MSLLGPVFFQLQVFILDLVRTVLVLPLSFCYLVLRQLATALQSIGHSQSRQRGPEWSSYPSSYHHSVTRSSASNSNSSKTLSEWKLCVLSLFSTVTVESYKLQIFSSCMFSVSSWSDNRNRSIKNCISCILVVKVLSCSGVNWGVNNTI